MIEFFLMHVLRDFLKYSLSGGILVSVGRNLPENSGRISRPGPRIFWNFCKFLLAASRARVPLLPWLHQQDAVPAVSEAARAPSHPQSALSALAERSLLLVCLSNLETDEAFTSALGRPAMGVLRCSHGMDTSSGTACTIYVQ